MSLTNYAAPRSAKEISADEARYEAIELQAKIVEDTLASHVESCFSIARDNRQASGVDNRIMRALRRRRREYDPEDADLVAATSNIYIPIIDLKCRAALSWMTDILANAEEQPWTLAPTPNPTIPENIKKVAIENLKQEILAMGISDMGAIVQAAKRYKELARGFVMDRATQAAMHMETLIRDRMLEGNWMREFRRFLDDVTTYPTAIFEAPILRSRERMRWVGDKIDVHRVVVRECERIDPLSVFPSRDSTNGQDGTYIIIKKQLTYAYLHECLAIEGFKAETIRKLLDKFQHSGARIDLNTDSEEDHLKERTDHTEREEYIDALVYYGVLKGQMLLDAGVLVDDPQKPYEAIVWVVDGETIYAVLNPHPLGVRPIHTTSFKKVNGCFWGEALPDLLESIERMANAAARNLAKNMSFSAGPFGEFDITRLSAEEEQPHQIEPGRLYRTEPSMTGTSEPVFRFQKVDSNAAELQGIVDQYLKLADDISGVPAYVLGNPQVAGAGRTMGGLSMLMGNAAKGIKQVLLNIDSDVIAPTVTIYYNHELKYGDDEAAKVDAQIIARGASGIMQRELSQSRTVEIMQVLTPYLQFIPPQGVSVLLREILKSRGYNVDEVIPDPKRGNAFAGLAQAPRPAPPSALEGTPRPPLDGRSMPPASPDAGFVLPAPTPTNMPFGA